MFLNNEIIQRFEQWMSEAKRHPQTAEPTAMMLATATRAGIPSTRIVLLKAFDERGFGFYTNKESRKGRELTENPQGAICFYWMALERQVRAEGVIEEVTPEEADEYFASRSRESRIGAWASDQSRPLASRGELLHRVEEATKRFEGQEVPRPPYWSGFRLCPRVVEFWQQLPYRLHDRDVYTYSGGGWTKSKLFP